MKYFLSYLIALVIGLSTCVSFTFAEEIQPWFNATFIPPQTLELNASGTKPDGVYVYEWYYNNRLLGRGATIEVSFEEGEIQRDIPITLKALPSSGESGSRTITFKVNTTKGNFYPIPKADISINESQKKVTFRASPSFDPDGDIVKYEWDFGDGTVGEGEVVTHPYAAWQSYPVTLTVTDTMGDSVTGAVVLTLGSEDPKKPLISEIILNPNKPLPDKEVNLSAVVSDNDHSLNDLTYRWEFGDGTTSSAGQSVDHAYREGTYTASLKVTDPDRNEAYKQITFEVKASNAGNSGDSSTNDTNDAGSGGQSTVTVPDYGKGGLVPCNGIDCGFSDLVRLGNRLLEWLLYMTPVIAAIMLTYAGWLYLTSGGDPGKVSTAHRILRKTALGIIIVLFAWLIVDNILDALLVGEGFWSFLK